MIHVGFDFLLGMAFGIIFADNSDKEELELNWALLIYLGPIAISVNSFKEDT